MSQDYEKITTAGIANPPAGLLAKVMERIKLEQEKRIRRRLWLFSASSALSLIALVLTFQMAKAEFSESGFLNFFSLLFSDFGVIISYWRNFLASLLESLPVISLMLFLGSLLLFINSLKPMVRNMKLFLRFS